MLRKPSLEIIYILNKNKQTKTSELKDTKMPHRAEGHRRKFVTTNNRHHISHVHHNTNILISNTVRCVSLQM